LVRSLGLLSLLLLVPLTIGHLAAEELPAAPSAQSRPSAAADQTAGAPVAPAPKIALDTKEVSGILGKEVQGAANEKMGRIIDVLVDRSGTTRAAVIDFGGFLGVGSRKIAVAWSALHFGTENGHERITLELTRDQVKAAPQIQEGKSIIVLGAVGDRDMSRLTSTAPEP
jgi:hypothetical protein